MSDNTRKWSKSVTTRYGIPEKDIYNQLMDLVEKESLAKSRAQLLLVERGLEHTNNPSPLVKEKVVYRDKPPITKVVYQDRPEEHIVEHLSDTKLGRANEKGQRASDHKLTNPNKAKSGLALEEKKWSKSEAIAGWIGGGILVSAIVGGLLYKVFTR